MSVSEMESYRDLILENIEYDHLCREFTTYREDLDEIVELMVETVCAKRKTTRIAGSDFPHEVVRSRFLKLDCSHIEFVMECLRNNTTEIRNMKQYDVKISHAALSDMEQIYSYIADRLLEPDTAMGQYNRIAEAIQSLNILPERCALVESEPERTQGLRQMLVDNYSVFYIVGEDAVSVARVLYSASDLVRRLRRMK